MSLLPKYATKETLTVIGALVAFWLALKVSAWSIRLIKAIFMKTSLAWLATFLVLGGTGFSGYGIGELCRSDTTSPKPLITDAQKAEAAIATAAKSDPATAVQYLKYLQNKSTTQLVSAQEPAQLKLSNSSWMTTPISTSMMFTGFAAAIMGIVIAVNHNDRRTSY